MANVPINVLAAVEAVSDVGPAPSSVGDWVGLAVIVLAAAVLVYSFSAGWGQVTRLAVQACSVGAAFAVLAVQVSNAGWLTGGDGPTLDWLIDHRSATWTSIATAITNLGGPAGTIAIGVVIALLLTWRSRRSGWRAVLPGAIVLGTVAVAAVLNALVKVLIGRERPPALTRLMDETNMSFPSGHVAGTTALVAVVLLVYLAGKPGRARAAASFAGAALIIVIIALTRLYLGVHWLSDTIGGALLGTTIVLAAAALVAAVPFLELRPAPLPTAEAKELASTE